MSDTKRDLLLAAAEMIESLLPSDELGECSMCLAPKRQSHNDDCPGKALIDKLRAAAGGA
jgi:hypothetical protein